MSHKATYWAFEQPAYSCAHKLVLILLADWADERGVAWPKQATLAAKAQISIRHLRDVLSELEADGLIRRVTTRRRDGRQGSNRYVLRLMPSIEVHDFGLELNGK